MSRQTDQELQVALVKDSLALLEVFVSLGKDDRQKVIQYVKAITAIGVPTP